MFVEAGAAILAQRNLRGWLRTENLKFFGANPKLEDKARVESLALPDMVYTDAVASGEMKRTLDAWYQSMGQ